MAASAASPDYIKFQAVIKSAASAASPRGVSPWARRIQKGAEYRQGLENSKSSKPARVTTWLRQLLKWVPPSGQSPCRKIRYNLVNPRYMETCSPPRREAASGRKSFQQFQLARSSQLLAQPPQQVEPQPSFSVSLDIWSNVFGDLVRRTPMLEKLVSLEALIKPRYTASLHGRYMAFF